MAISPIIFVFGNVILCMDVCLCMVNMITNNLDNTLSILNLGIMFFIFFFDIQANNMPEKFGLETSIYFADNLYTFFTVVVSEFLS